MIQKLQNNYDILDKHFNSWCGSEGDWRQVVYLNMTDNTNNCPFGWRRITDHKRTCGRVKTDSLTCDSVFFPVTGGDYNKVCGRIKAYQKWGPDAFEAYSLEKATTIDEAYVSGISLTYGSPQKHIWTFAAGFTEGLQDLEWEGDACPCDATGNIPIPSFVGESYFCESGQNSIGYYRRFHVEDPLWDGKNCSSTSTCCEFNNPPYFTKQLSSSTSEAIEARICHLDKIDDTPVELLELYVK